MAINNRRIKKVLFIYPFTEIDKKTIYGINSDRQGKIIKGDKIEPSLGIGYLFAYLKKQTPELKIEIFDANAMAIKMCVADNAVDIPKLWAMLRDKIIDSAPDIVGISCFSLLGAASTKKAALAIKQIDTRIIVVIGGNYANTSYDESLTGDSSIDIVVFSEGEYVFSNLINAINNKKNLDTVKGIAFRDIRGGIIKTKPEDLIKNVNDIPECDRSGMDIDFYSKGGNYFIYRFFDRESTRVAPIMASRGCQRYCTFCTARLIWGGKIRYRKPSFVVDEMLRLRDKYGINAFTFFDANMWSNKKSFLALAYEIIKRMSGCRWVSIEGSQVSSLVDQEVVEATCASGCKWFVLPFESGNSKTLKQIQKSHTIDMVEPVIRNIRKIEGTWIGGNLITGFPWETPEDIQKSFDYTNSLDMDWLYVYRFIPFPGIPMYQECLDAGFTRKYSWHEEHIGELFTLNTPFLEADYIAERNYEFNIKYNFIHNRNLKRNPMQALRDFDYVLQRSKEHAFAMYMKGRVYEELKDKKEAKYWYEEALKTVKKEDNSQENPIVKNNQSMESISKSFVVIKQGLTYGKYFKNAGIDLEGCLRGLI